MVSLVGFIDRAFDDIAPRAAKLGIVPINLARIAERLWQQCPPGSVFVGVGNSSADITQFWPNTKIITQAIETIVGGRDRQRRVLEADQVIASGDVTLVDDVAVSGRTLEAALRSVNTDGEIAIGIGAAWNSRRLRGRLGTYPVCMAVRYRQRAGGVPPMNSLSTLATTPGLMADFVSRQPGLNSRVSEVEKIIEIYQEVS